MINREDGLDEIYERLKANRIILGLTKFKRNPTRPAVEEDLPCVFMIEGNDIVIEHSKRSKTGYPAKRVMEVTIEIITTKEVNIKQLFQDIRRVIFTEPDSDPIAYTPIVAENTFISENRTEGPSGYGLPDIVGMALVLDLVYTDKAFTQ